MIKKYFMLHLMIGCCLGYLLYHSQQMKVEIMKKNGEIKDLQAKIDENKESIENNKEENQNLRGILYKTKRIVDYNYDRVRENKERLDTLHAGTAVEVIIKGDEQ